ncbi:MAG: YebC/PmpR family DNA-binding transcriptional regulator [Patescibacteria group bacterium]
MFDRPEQEWIPKYPMEVDQKTKDQLEKLFAALDENDDVQEIYSNLKT